MSFEPNSRLDNHPKNHIELTDSIYGVDSVISEQSYNPDLANSIISDVSHSEYRAPSPFIPIPSLLHLSTSFNESEFNDETSDEEDYGKDNNLKRELSNKVMDSILYGEPFKNHLSQDTQSIITQDSNFSREPSQLSWNSSVLNDNQTNFSSDFLKNDLVRSSSRTSQSSLTSSLHINCENIGDLSDLNDYERHFNKKFITSTSVQSTGLDVNNQNESDTHVALSPRIKHDINDILRTGEIFQNDGNHSNGLISSNNSDLNIVPSQSSLIIDDIDSLRKNKQNRKRSKSFFKTISNPFAESNSNSNTIKFTSNNNDNNNDHLDKNQNINKSIGSISKSPIKFTSSNESSKFSSPLRTEISKHILTDMVSSDSSINSESSYNSLTKENTNLDVDIADDLSSSKRNKPPKLDLSDIPTLSPVLELHRSLSSKLEYRDISIKSPKHDNFHYDYQSPNTKYHMPDLPPSSYIGQYNNELISPVDVAYATVMKREMSENIANSGHTHNNSKSIFSSIVQNIRRDNSAKSPSSVKASNSEHFTFTNKDDTNKENSGLFKRYSGKSNRKPLKLTNDHKENDIDKNDNISTPTEYYSPGMYKKDNVSELKSSKYKLPDIPVQIPVPGYISSTETVTDAERKRLMAKLDTNSVNPAVVNDILYKTNNNFSNSPIYNHSRYSSDDSTLSDTNKHSTLKSFQGILEKFGKNRSGNASKSSSIYNGINTSISMDENISNIEDDLIIENDSPVRESSAFSESDCMAFHSISQIALTKGVSVKENSISRSRALSSPDSYGYNSPVKTPKRINTQTESSFHHKKDSNGLEFLGQSYEKALSANTDDEHSKSLSPSIVNVNNSIITPIEVNNGHGSNNVNESSATNEVHNNNSNSFNSVSSDQYADVFSDDLMKINENQIYDVESSKKPELESLSFHLRMLNLSEQAYIMSLELLSNKYLGLIDAYGLSRIGKNDYKITIENCDKIKSNYSKILSCHKVIASEKIVEISQLTPLIFVIRSHIDNLFEVYSEFVANFPSSISAIQYLNSKPQFRSFINKKTNVSDINKKDDTHVKSKRTSSFSTFLQHIKRKVPSNKDVEILHNELPNNEETSIYSTLKSYISTKNTKKTPRRISCPSSFNLTDMDNDFSVLENSIDSFWMKDMMNLMDLPNKRLQFWLRILKAILNLYKPEGSISKNVDIDLRIDMLEDTLAKFKLVVNKVQCIREDVYNDISLKVLLSNLDRYKGPSIRFLGQLELTTDLSMELNDENLSPLSSSTSQSENSHNTNVGAYVFERGFILASYGSNNLNYNENFDRSKGSINSLSSFLSLSNHSNSFKRQKSLTSRSKGHSRKGSKSLITEDSSRKLSPNVDEAFNGLYKETESLSSFVTSQNNMHFINCYILLSSRLEVKLNEKYSNGIDINDKQTIVLSPNDVDNSNSVNNKDISGNTNISTLFFENEIKRDQFYNLLTERIKENDQVFSDGNSVLTAPISSFTLPKNTKETNDLGLIILMMKRVDLDFIKAEYFGEYRKHWSELIQEYAPYLMKDNHNHKINVSKDDFFKNVSTADKFDVPIKSLRKETKDGLSPETYINSTTHIKNSEKSNLEKMQLIKLTRGVAVNEIPTAEKRRGIVLDFNQFSKDFSAGIKDPNKNIYNDNSNNEFKNINIDKTNKKIDNSFIKRSNLRTKIKPNSVSQSTLHNKSTTPIGDNSLKTFISNFSEEEKDISCECDSNNVLKYQTHEHQFSFSSKYKDSGTELIDQSSDINFKMTTSYLKPTVTNFTTEVEMDDIDGLYKKVARNINEDDLNFDKQPSLYVESMSKSSSYSSFYNKNDKSIEISFSDDNSTSFNKNSSSLPTQYSKLKPEQKYDDLELDWEVSSNPISTNEENSIMASSPKSANFRYSYFNSGVVSRNSPKLEYKDTNSRRSSTINYNIIKSTSIGNISGYSGDVGSVSTADIIMDDNVLISNSRSVSNLSLPISMLSTPGSKSFAENYNSTSSSATNTPQSSLESDAATPDFSILVNKLLPFSSLSERKSPIGLPEVVVTSNTSLDNKNLQDETIIEPMNTSLKNEDSDYLDFKDTVNHIIPNNIVIDNKKDKDIATEFQLKLKDNLYASSDKKHKKHVNNAENGSSEYNEHSPTNSKNVLNKILHKSKNRSVHGFEGPFDSHSIKTQSLKETYGDLDDTINKDLTEMSAALFTDDPNPEETASLAIPSIRNRAVIEKHLQNNLYPDKVSKSKRLPHLSLKFDHDDTTKPKSSSSTLFRGLIHSNKNNQLNSSIDTLSSLPASFDLLYRPFEGNDDLLYHENTGNTFENEIPLSQSMTDSFRSNKNNDKKSKGFSLFGRDNEPKKSVSTSMKKLLNTSKLKSRKVLNDIKNISSSTDRKHNSKNNANLNINTSGLNTDQHKINTNNKHSDNLNSCVISPFYDDVKDIFSNNMLNDSEINSIRMEGNAELLSMSNTSEQPESYLYSEDVSDVESMLRRKQTMLLP